MKRGASQTLQASNQKLRSRPISRVLSRTAIPLGRTLPCASSGLPGSNAGRATGSLFGLAPGGVCRAGPLPDSRCALTAPFHPCRPACAVLGGIFLLHFPSARAAQALPGTVPCGARTFLRCLRNGDCPADSVVRIQQTANSRQRVLRDLNTGAILLTLAFTDR